jgi:RecA/RadA recombinase
MITNIYGQSGSGKSQLCFTLCANCAKDSANILFIDTTGNFRPERIMEISGSKLNLEKISYIRAFTTTEQSNATKKIIEERPRLVVIDSLTSLFSTEYSGPERHRAIMKYMVRNAPPITLVDQGGRNVSQAVMPWQQREFLGSSVSIYSHIKMKLEIVDSAKSSFQAVLMQPPGKEPVPFAIMPSGISDKQ